MPCPSTGPKIVCDGPNVMCQNKIYLDIEPFPNFLRQTKKLFAFSKFIFSGSVIFFGVAPNAIQFLVWLKIFGPVQNILGPVKGQGINIGHCNTEHWSKVDFKLLSFKTKSFRCLTQKISGSFRKESVSETWSNQIVFP